MSGRSGVKPIRDDVAKILSAYVKGNAVAPDELPALIAQVGALLYGLKPVAPAPPIPANAGGKM